MCKYLSFILFFVFFAFEGRAQNMNYRSFDNILLSSEASVVNCFVQDEKGLIWIGTNRGLYSYDGHTTQSHSAIGDNSYLYIYCGVKTNNLIYFGTDNGVLIYNYYTDEFESDSLKFPHDVRSMVLLGDTLWLGSLNGLFSFNVKNKEIKEITDANIPHRAIYSIEKTGKNSLFIGTYNGLCKYDNISKKFESVDIPYKTDKSNNFINSLLYDESSNRLWIGTEGTLLCYTLNNHKIEAIEAVGNNSIKSLAKDINQNILVGTDNGLYVHNTKDNITQHITHDSRNNNSLSNNIVWSIFADRGQNIWLGTDLGISLAHYNKEAQTIPISQITKNADGNRFYSIYKDSQKNIWLGGANGLIRTNNALDSCLWYKMDNGKYSLPHNRVRDIYEDSERNLWIATDGGICKYNYQNRTFESFNIVDSTHKFNANWAYRIIEDNQNQLWISTCLGGVFVVNKENLIHSKTKNYIAERNYNIGDGLSGSFANHIVADKNGYLWVLVYNGGIDRIEMATGKISKVDISEQSGGEGPNYIIDDENDNVWIGFRGGVIKYDTRNNSMTTVKFKNFADKEIIAMANQNENLWISTSESLLFVNKATLEIRRIDIANKIYTSLFFDRETNKMYMGTTDAIVVIGANITKRKIDSDVNATLTALYTNGKLYKSQQSIRYAKKISLQHNQNYITCEFSELNFAQDATNKFAYMLEGADNRWNAMKTGDNRISYSNLKPGKYILKIGKLNANGSYTNVLKNFEIEILPPWYLTNIAKIAYLLLLLGILAWILNFFRVRNNLKIERIEKEKSIEQAQLKMEFFQNVSHEFKTPLSMIIAPVSKMLLESKNQQTKKQLELVQQNALKLNTLISQTLDFERVDSSTDSTLIISKIEFIEFARSIFETYKESFADKNFNFSFSANRDKIYANIDVVKIESVLNNLISNACKYTPNGGNISLAVNYNEIEKCLNILVSDNGIGIPEQDVPYVFQRFFKSSKTIENKEGTGVGLYLAKKFTEMHDGTLAVKSQENQGTTFVLLLPTKIKTEDETLEQTSQTVENSAKERILIVEDNASVAEFICQMLEQKYECVCANNGKSGFDICLQTPINLIITDEMMPVMNGMEMCRQLRKNVATSTIPIIMLTAKDDKKTELESINLDINAFISKPFDPTILQSRVSQLLREQQTLEDKMRIEQIAEPKAIEAISENEKFLHDITQIIEDNVADFEFNVNALSQKSEIGAKQIYRKIKQLTGQTPVDYIKSIRLKKAAMLLKQKKFTIAEVMYMVGFSNASYFSKCFAAEFGVTPKEYDENKID